MSKLIHHALKIHSRYIALIGILAFLMLTTYLVDKSFHLRTGLETLTNKEKQTVAELQKIKSDLEKLKNEDQYKRNEALQKDIVTIESTYKKSVSVYEELLKLKEVSKKTDKLDEEFTKILVLLSDRNYASAESSLKTLSSDIKKEQAKFVGSVTIPANVATNNAPPGSGYRRQKVDTPVGSYLVDIIAADLNSTRVIVDTASETTCANDCPVASLGDYVGRSGGFAGVNGPYFCPATYPSCAGKANSFDTLLMNKNKVYFNPDNNVYSTVPAIIFSGNSGRLVGQSLQWGRDQGVDSVIASQPMLTSGGSRVFGGDGEPKRTGKGSRSFIGFTGSTAYIGVVQGASVAEVAYVMETLGIQNSLNLDSGGSTALMYQGRYLLGPGRQTPFGIVFTGK